ncbi:MAG: hypothetical protein J1F42_00860 [Lachnospiraceae bacterium]|nr:hypothetical protein [Lachnospiraceae bacterium]
MLEISVQNILEYLEQNGYDVRYVGSKDIVLEGYCQLDKLKSHSITWIKKASDDIKYDLSKLTGGVVVTDNKISYVGKKVGVIITNAPKAVFFAILNYFFVETDLKQSIGKNTVIGDKVTIGKNVVIGSNCSIVGDITIGDNTIISDNVVIKNRVVIGKNCEIQALTVIGEDGFGYFERANNQKVMIRHHGGVFIGNDVFIGSHVNIARGTMDNTIIGDGVKIAPSTHIGHNNHIEQDAIVICAQLYGSVHVGENAYIVGSIVRNQCSVGENTMVGMGSVVTQNIDNNKVAIGIPAKVIRER